MPGVDRYVAKAQRAMANRRGSRYDYSVSPMTRFSFCGCCTSPSSLAFLFPVFSHEDGKSPNQAMGLTSTRRMFTF